MLAVNCSHRRVYPGQRARSLQHGEALGAIKRPATSLCLGRGIAVNGDTIHCGGFDRLLEETSVGDLLRRHRVAAGLTQQDLAERAGVSLRGLSDLERGARRAPHRDTVLRLADALGLGQAARSMLLAERLPTARSAKRMRPPQAWPLFTSERILPTHLTSFVGREREVAEVKRLLESSRLLTLIGSGGVGKTRLAVTVAREWLTEGCAFVAFIDLAPLSDAELVPQTVAAQLGVPEQPRRPVMATLIGSLQGMAGLLVLDNCEHLVQACAVLAHELLTACPGLRILSTKREPLSIAGETVWRVPSLSLGEPPLHLEQIATSEAARLFAERAPAVPPTFR